MDFDARVQLFEYAYELGLWSEVGGAATHGGADLSDINVTINDIANCTIPVVDKAKYLGSILDREPGHETDVDARIAAASSAFAKLKPLVRTKAAYGAI